jgi:hypothetical protein
VSAGTITAVKPNPKNPAQGFVKVALPDGSELEVWTPEFPKAEALNGKPIPDDWSLRDNKAGTGKVLLPPKDRQATAYRNTKEAFEAEAASRLAWQQVEEERKDRRTALMQAAEYVGSWDSSSHFTDIMPIADFFYEWLRSSPAAGPASPGAGVATTAEATTTPVAQASSGQAGDTSSGEGEAPDTGPEGGTLSAIGKPPSGSTKFPVDPAKCNHRTSIGHWVNWYAYPEDDGHVIQVCPKCGTPRLIAMESGGPYS